METPSWWNRWTPSANMGEMPWTCLGAELDLARFCIHLLAKTLPGRNRFREDAVRDFRYSLL